MTRSELTAVVSKHLHAEQRIDAARIIAQFSGANPKMVDKEDVALEYCNSLLHYHLNSNNYFAAAQMLWTNTLFTPEPRSTQMVWDVFQRSNSFMLMGAASMSKSYSGGVWMFLDWLRDPYYTSVNLVGPSENHLKDNLFSHLVSLHNSSSIPLPGQIGDLFIGLDPRDRKSSIKGIVIPLGSRPAGRLQGRKRVPRTRPHPVLGPLSRIRFFLDEAEKIPIGVWKDVDNVLANLTSDIDGFKIGCAFNPEDPNGQVAIRCEPTKGWEEFNIDEDEKWKSKRGWDIVRLDAAKSENVMTGREIFAGLQTKQGYDRIIQNAGGVDTPGYWTMARACFPKTGAIYSVMPSNLVSRMRGEFLFAEEPVTCAGADLALEGNDKATLAIGRFGRAVGVKKPPTFDSPNGSELMFKDKQGKPRFRWALQVDRVYDLPKGDTVAMAETIHKDCTRMGVKPGNVMLDRTGNGAGVHDFLRTIWSGEVRGVNYQEGATEKKILVEDTKTAKDEYARAVSELWFALKKWSEFNFVRLGTAAYEEELVRELTGRRYASDKLTKVETKDEYKSRGNPSPNKADAVTLLLHGVRLATGCIPSSTDDMEGVTGVAYDPSSQPVPSWTGHSDAMEFLD